MKVTRYAGDEERTICVGLVTNDQIVNRIVTGLKGEDKPFRSKWANIIYGWCSEFFQKYGKAPKGTIQSVFRSYAARNEGETSTELVERFLVALDTDYRNLSKELNVDYVVDLASKYFNQVRYARLRDELEEGLLAKDDTTVQSAVSAFHPINFTQSATVDVLTDEKEWMAALEHANEEVLIEYSGALGEFFGSHLQRDGFIAFLAPEKRGKSFWLIDAAWRAVRSRRRTFVISAGDMSKRQMLRRFGVRAARRPIEPGEVLYPRKLIRTVTGEPKVKMERESYDSVITRKEWRKAQESIHQLTSSKDSLLKLACYPNSSVNIDGIRADLDSFIKEGWIPDVVVLDYMDILAPEAGTKGQNLRDQINENWKAMRRLTQDYHVLGVTATQSNADSYEAKIITRRNFSEDKRKLAHVTGMIGINQTEEEKKLGLYRLNWTALREGVYFENKCVTVAGSLAIANPAMKSIW